MNDGANSSLSEVWLVSPTNGQARGTWTMGTNNRQNPTTTFVDEIIGSSPFLPTPIAGPTHSTFAGYSTYSDEQGVVSLTFSSTPNPGFLGSCVVHGLAVFAPS